MSLVHAGTFVGANGGRELKCGKARVAERGREEGTVASTMNMAGEDEIEQ